MPIMGSILGGNCKFFTYKTPIHLEKYQNRQLDFKASLIPVLRPRNSMFFSGFLGLSIEKRSLKSLGEENGAIPIDEEEDDELCPVECVREFKTDEEFINTLEKAKRNNALVVVDFYKNSCGSCKYIEQGFSKLCKASGNDDAPVIFLKHNVIDEYDEQSEVPERLRIKTVPLFHFYKNGDLLESFATRDKERITKAIYKHSSSSPQDTES